MTSGNKSAKVHYHINLDATPVPGHAEVDDTPAEYVKKDPVLGAAQLPGHAESADTPAEYVQKDPVAPSAHPRITHIDDKTVHYEMPYSLPKGIYSTHPISGYLVETNDGSWKTLADDHHREKELPRYIKHGDDALRYITDSHEHFRAGLYAGNEADRIDDLKD